jgi:hypothetical protein
MLLKDFILDLPYKPDQGRIKMIIQEKDCQYDEAVNLDYQQNWKQRRFAFRYETRCITAMFSRLLGKMKTEDCWNVLVECVPYIIEERILNFSGVYTVQVQFDHQSFFEKSESDKKAVALELLMQGIRKIEKNKGWSIESFEKVYVSIKNLNYKNEWIWRKSLNSPNRKHLAEVHCQHNVQSMDISILIKDRKGAEIKRQQIISELPYEIAYAQHLGQLRWVSDNKVSLINQDANHSWTVEI